jgi:mono/diheme cytochrome c family protein
VEDQYTWVAEGKPPNEAYGTRGISTGRMPHFGSILTREQIQAIVDYERGL